MGTPIKEWLVEAPGGGTEFKGEGSLGHKVAKLLEEPFKLLDGLEEGAEEFFGQGKADLLSDLGPAGSDLWTSIVTPIWSLAKDLKGSFVDILSKHKGDEELTRDTFYHYVKQDVQDNAGVLDRLMHKLMDITYSAISEQQPFTWRRPPDGRTLAQLLERAVELRNQMKQAREEAKKKKKTNYSATLFASIAAKPKGNQDDFEEKSEDELNQMNDKDRAEYEAKRLEHVDRKAKLRKSNTRNVQEAQRQEADRVEQERQRKIREEEEKVPVMVAGICYQSICKVKETLVRNLKTEESSRMISDIIFNFLDDSGSGTITVKDALRFRKLTQTLSYQEGTKSFARVKGLVEGLFHVDWDGGGCLNVERVVTVLDRLATGLLDLGMFLLKTLIGVIEDTLREVPRLVTDMHRTIMDGGEKGFTRAHIENYIHRFLDKRGRQAELFAQETWFGLLRLALETLDVRATGLKWRKVAEKPQQGVELSNTVYKELAKKLPQKTEFTQEEWDKFGIKDLDNHNFIEAGGAYFQPAMPGVDELGKIWAIMEPEKMQMSKEHTVMMDKLFGFLGGPSQGEISTKRVWAFLKVMRIDCETRADDLEACEQFEQFVEALIAFERKQVPHKEWVDFSPPKPNGPSAEERAEQEGAKMSEDEVRAKLRAVFDEFDEDKSGGVDVAEMSKMVAQMSMDISDEQLAEMIKEADADGSGEIEFEEFLLIIKKMQSGGEASGPGSSLGSIFSAKTDSMFGKLKIRLFAAFARQTMPGSDENELIYTADISEAVNGIVLRLIGDEKSDHESVEERKKAMTDTREAMMKFEWDVE